jgi:hypothetical protein
MPKKPRKRAALKQRDPTLRMRRALGHKVIAVNHETLPFQKNPAQARSKEPSRPIIVTRPGLA